MDWSGFFMMGGYAVFVWSSYAITLALLTINAVQPLLRERALLTRLRRRHGERA